MVRTFIHFIILRDWYRYSIQYQISISNGKKYYNLSCKIVYTDTALKYEIDFTATWISPHEGNLLFISNIYDVDCAKPNKISF